MQLESFQNRLKRLNQEELIRLGIYRWGNNHWIWMHCGVGFGLNWQTITFLPFYIAIRFIPNQIINELLIAIFCCVKKSSIPFSIRRIYLRGSEWDVESFQW